MSNRNRSGNITYQRTQDMLEPLAQRVEELEDATGTGGGNGPNTDLQFVGPQPIAVEQIKSKAFVTLKCAVPSGIQKLKVVLEQYTPGPDPVTVVRRVNDTDKEVPSETSDIGGPYTFRFDIGLAFNASYGSPRLVAIMKDGSVLSNPDPSVPDTPRLLSDYLPDSLFTLAAAFGSPSAPHIGNIIKNEFDTVTKAFDAFITIQVIAPASATVTSTGTVQVVNNSTAIVGTLTTFSAQAAVGKAITVNGETHIITNVADNTHLTVDFPFKQTSGSGFAANILTLGTWDSFKSRSIICKFRLTDDVDGRALTKHHDLSSDERSQTSVIFRVDGFVAARKYNWMRNVLKDEAGEEANITPIATQTFVAGGFVIDTPGLPELTSPIWSYTDTDPYNDVARYVRFYITQPDPLVALDRVEIRVDSVGVGAITYTTGVASITGIGTTFLADFEPGDVIVVGTLLAAGYQRLTVLNVANNTSLTVENTTLPTATVGGGGIAYKRGHIRGERFIRKAKFHPVGGGKIKIEVGEIRTKKLTNLDIVVVLRSQYGNVREDVDNFTTGSSSDGAAQPAALTFPAAPTGTNNTVDGDPEKAQARVTLTFATASTNTFTVDNISAIEIEVVRRNQANSANDPVSATPIPFYFNLSTADIATNSVTKSFFIRAGERYRITKVVARNGDKRTETTGTADFLAAQLLIVYPGDAKTVPAPTFGAITREDGSNKIDLVPVTVSQDTIDTVWFKQLIFEVNINSGGYQAEQPEPLKFIDSLHTGPTASYTKTFRIKRKAGVTAQYRVTAIAVGGKSSAQTTSASQGATADDVAADTAVPTLATNPVTGTTGPTVKERISVIKATAPTPSANTSTLYEYQFVLTTSSSAPAGTPTIGSEGVVDITYGQSVKFHISYELPFDGDLYVAFRARNKFATNNGYSVWSAATNQHGYSRPIQDFIGDAPPDSPEGLVRTTTGSGASSTTFTLDGAASSEANFYVGMAFHLASPGTASPAEDTWRTITAYNNGTKVITVSPAWSSTPGAGITFDIHRIEVTGDRANKSQTTHSTTTFQLDSGASAVTDFYKGYTLYVPTLAANDRVRKVTAYNAGTKTVTVDTAFGGGTPSGSQGFLIVNGSIGFSTPNNADTFAGIGSPVSYRWYLDDLGFIQFETLPPVGENAFSMTHFQIRCRRRNVSAPVRADSGAVAIVSGSGWSTPAPSGIFFAGTIRFRNLFRSGGSDGWGIESYHVNLPDIAASPNYDPDTYGGPVIIDYQGEDSYPINYPSY